MRKRFMVSVLAAAVMILASGCGSEAGRKAAINEPVTITVWHYYNGVQKEEFDELVRSFNETEGREKGIIVEAQSKGGVDELSQMVEDSLEKKIGSDPLPDVFAAYADKVYEIDQKGMAVDLSQYLTEQEQGEYVDAYIEEGKFDEGQGVKVLPVAKSTEVFAINKTDWDKFAEATGESEAAFSTWEGITRVAEAYYKWTDSLTETPEDGRAFFGRDAFANYIIIGSLQLGHEIFQVENGKPVMDFDRTAMKRLWDNYYVPYVNGYFASYGKFRSDDVKTGQLAAFVGSTSGMTYFPSSVTLEDGTNYEIENKVYPLPNFTGTTPCAVQQGAGMMVLKSEKKREQAAVEFLKWFTEVEHNIRFSVVSGYLPVKKAAGDRANLESALKKETGEPADISENLMIGLDTANKYRLYTTKPFEGGDQARAVLNTSMSDRAREDRQKVLDLMAQGVLREEAVSQFVSEENFDRWYEDTKQQLEAIVGE